MNWGEMKAKALANNVPDDAIVSMEARDGISTPSFTIPGWTYQPAAHRKEVEDFDVRAVAS